MITNVLITNSTLLWLVFFMNSSPVFLQKLNNKCYTCTVSFLYEQQPYAFSNLKFDHKCSCQKFHILWLFPFMNSGPVFLQKLNYKFYTCTVSFLHKQHPCASSNLLTLKFAFIGICFSKICALLSSTLNYQLSN